MTSTQSRTKHLKSIEEFLAVLREHGDVQEVTAPVSLQLEAGAGIRYAYENNLPAVLYTTIDGYPQYKLMGGVTPFSSDPHNPYGRLAVALGLPWDTKPLAILEALVEFNEAHRLIPPVVVDNTTRTRHDTVDLHSVPAPLLHDGDGGEYLNTVGTMVARTPDGSWTNWHVCRVMRLDATRVTIWTRDFQHFGQIYNMWKEIGKPMPFAFCQSPEPSATVVSGFRVPAQVDEAAFLGGWFGEALEVSPCDSVDLEVPATSHVVIEGHINIDERHSEGPFGECAGYLIPSLTCEELVGHVTAISSVPQPIVAAVPAGKPVDDDHTLIFIGHSMGNTQMLRDAGLPVRHCWVSPESAGSQCTVTVDKNWPETYSGDRVALFTEIANLLNKQGKIPCVIHTAVVEDDIDPTDPRDVLWGWCSRAAATEMLTLDGYITELSVGLSLDEHNAVHGNRNYYNGLHKGWSLEYTPASFTEIYPPDVQRKMKSVIDDAMDSRRG
ncbi:UbiD family decarboxylase domain-containing protein [Nocardia sp. NPDC002869]|uniref:UbiD family decarboxylase domain-containing protein n=1 Tax=Nocardia sp. NPDC002869 TaxID=3161032 RepID=UPI00398D38EE